MTTPAVEVEHLTKAFGLQTVIDDLSLRLMPGDRAVILGHNGAGKTTLVRCLLGEYRPDSGSVRIAGFDLQKNRKAALARVAFVPQISPPLRHTVADLLAYAQSTGACSEESVCALCEKFEFDPRPHLNKPFYRLSGGMKQKILASIALARPADLLIFDEPTANLDAVGRTTFMDLVGSQSMAGRSMIFISHRLEEVRGLATRSIELDFGRIVHDEQLAQ